MTNFTIRFGLPAGSNLSFALRSWLIFPVTALESIIATLTIGMESQEKDVKNMEERSE